MKLHLRPLVIAAMLLACGNLFSYTFTWNGNTSTAWTISTNWTRTGSGSSNTTPGTNDSVVINTLGGVSPRYPSLSATATIAKFTMNGGSLTTNSNFTASVAFLLKGGTFTSTSNNITTGAMTVTGGTLGVNDDITVTNALTVTAGTVNADGEVTANVVLVNGGTLNLTNTHTLTGTVSITVTSGLLNGNSNTTIKTSTNGDLLITGGIINVAGDNISVGDNFTINGGTVNVTSANGAFPKDLFLKSGTLDLSNHSLTIADTFSYTGGSITHITSLSADIFTIDANTPALPAIDLTISALTVNINSPLTLVGDLNITTSMTFIKGIVVSTSSNLVIFDADATTSGASDIGHVNGPVRHLLTGTNSTNNTNLTGFKFPVGDGTHYAYASLSDFNDSRSQDYFTVQYFNAIPNSQGSLTSLNHISREEYWTIDRAATSGTPNTDARITLSFDETRSGGISTLADLRVAHWNSSLVTWESIGTGTTVTGNTSAGAITSNARSTSFSPFTIGSSTTLNPLPVSLINFSAKTVEKAIGIYWTTASEINNDHFIVEKSIDGHNWAAIATVKGAINSDKALNYEAIDANPVAGLQYYRVTMVDLNGHITYSQLAAVNYASIAAKVSIFPNPVSSNLNVSIEGDASSVAKVSVYNAFGQKIMETGSQGGSVLNLDMSAMKNGIYVLEVNCDGVVTKTRIVKN